LATVDVQQRVDCLAIYITHSTTNITNMKISIRKKNVRSDWSTKPILLNFLLAPILFALPIAAIYIATTSTVASATCKEIRDAISALKQEREALEKLLNDGSPDPTRGKRAYEIKRQIKILDVAISQKGSALFRCMGTPLPQ
jgi:hypothetical protein